MIGDWEIEVFFKRINEIDDKVAIPLLPLDLFPYKPEEIKRLIYRGNPMILDGFLEGKCLYNDDFFRKTRDLLKRMLRENVIEKTGGI
ncbi:MAG: hypothetical protein ACTSWN_11295 [Promethearchaeota archaeon]